MLVQRPLSRLVSQITKFTTLSLLIAFVVAFANDQLLLDPAVDKYDQVCRGGQHVVGRWIPIELETKTYYVCSWDNDDFLKNPKMCGGYRRSEPLQRGSYPLLSQTGGHASFCDMDDDTREIAADREKYIWKPMLCELLSWNAMRFCRLLGSRKILMIGDSTMQQTAAALMTRLTWDGALCAPQIGILRFNTLHQDARDWIRNFQPSIIIVNVGPHVHTMNDFYEELRLLKELIYDIDKSWPNNHIKWAWKTMNPGHPDCHNNTTPITYDWPYNESTLYRWEEFAKMDSVVRISLPTPEYKNMQIIDMSPLYY